jgi:Ni,Fe-hydrogenase maturation factor
MQSARTKRILVIGVGNEYRGDDGVGAYVAGQIGERALLSDGPRRVRRGHP